MGELSEAVEAVVNTLMGVKWRLEEAMKARESHEKDEILAVACMILVKALGQLDEIYDMVKAREEVEGGG